MNKLLISLRENPIFKKYEIYLAPIVAVLIVIVLIALVVVPNSIQYFQTNSQITENEEKLTFFQKKAQILAAINKEQYKTGLNSSLLILPSDTEAPAAISQLYYIVNQTNINLQNINFSEANSSDGKSFRMHIEITSSLTGLTNFILKVKESPRLMRIVGLEVANQGGEDRIFATLDLNAYYEPLPAVNTSPDQEVKVPTEKDLEALAKLSKSTFPIISENTNFGGGKGKTNPFK